MVEIPNINKLKESIIKNKIEFKKKTKKNNKRKINTILKKRIKSRELWNENRRKKHERFLNKLKSANDNLISAISNEIINKTKFVLENNTKVEAFKLVNPQNINCDLCNFSPDTIIKGFWNPKTRKHSRINHFEAKINDDPIITISKNFKNHGYIIEDITEENEDNNIVIKVTFNFN